MSKPIFKEDMVWRGYAYTMEVFDDNDYSKLNNITQVYGFIFNEKGEILVVKCGHKKEWCLPGGGPEKYDKTWKDTLIREVDEETDVEIKGIMPAGYIRVTAKDKNESKAKTDFCIRSIAFVKGIKKQTIDPANGMINERKFIPVKDFLKYCPWGENGKVQLEIAIRAKEAKS